MKRPREESAEVIINAFIEDIDEHILRKYDLLLGQIALYAPVGGVTLEDLRKSWIKTLDVQLKLRDKRAIATKKLLAEIKEVRTNQALGIMIKGGQ